MQKQSKCRTDKKQKCTWLNMQKDILKNLKIQNHVQKIKIKKIGIFSVLGQIRIRNTEQCQRYS